MVRAGLGITLLPEIAVEQAVRDGIRIIHVEPTLTRVVYFISHREDASLLQSLQ